MPPLRLRREPPQFRRVEVRRTRLLSPRLLRLSLGGTELDGFDLGLPAASVRLLLPRPGAPDLAVPAWNGNEFLHADGSRPTIRTYTPRRHDPTHQELDIDVVLHEHGAVPAWATAARAGDPAGISGPGRGYTLDPSATSFLLLGDESAIPAISQLLEHLPPGVDVHAVIEVARRDARHQLPRHPGAVVDWCDQAADAPPGSTLLAAIAASQLDAGTRVWAAGEAAAMQRIRRHLFDERGVARPHAVVRGYWKVGRGGDAADD